MDEKGYNGYTNYETWCIALWINNDAGYQSYIREMLDGLEPYAAMEALKEHIEENNPLNDLPSMYSDLLGSAISEANFYEIAQSILDDIAEEKDDEDDENEEN